MNEMNLYIIIYLISVFLSSISQITLKASANKKYNNTLREYLNIRVIVAYSLFFLSSLVTIYALKVVPLSMGPILEASGYIHVAVLGTFVLKERFYFQKIVGYGTILLGIVVFVF